MNLYDSTNLAIESLLQVKRLERTRLDGKTQKAAKAEINTACYVIEELINAVKENRLDGGAGSGNWGHIGIPGHWGGSQKGGGNAFRLATTSYATKANNYKHVKEEFTSQAKIRNKLNQDLKDAKESNSEEAVEKVKKRLSQINNRTKTALTEEELRRRGYTDEEIAEKFDVVHKRDEKASEHILENDNENSTGTRAGGEYTRGTAEGVKQTKAKKNSSSEKSEDKDKGKDKTESEGEKDKGGNEENKNEQHSNTVERNYDSQMAKKLGTTHYDKVVDALDAAEQSVTKDIFRENINSVLVGNTSGEAYFDPGNRTINFSVKENEETSDDGKPAQQTMFHESAHALDYKAGGGISFAAQYNGGELANTLKEEHKSNLATFKKGYAVAVDKAIEEKDYAALYKMGAIGRKTYKNLTDEKRAETYDEEGIEKLLRVNADSAARNIKYTYQKAILNQYATDVNGNVQYGAISGLSDLTSAASGNTMNLGYGHRNSYWRRGGNIAVATETDANISATAIVSSQGLDAIKNIYPKTYAVWQKMKEAQREKLNSMKG